MKLFLGLLVVLGTSAVMAAPSTFVCGMKDTGAKPYLTFLAKVDGKKHSSIRYIKSAFYGSEEVAVERAIEGCEAGSVDQLIDSPKELYLECAGDGDAGFLTVKLASGKGTMNFPNGGVEGYDDTEIPVTCQKQK